MFMGENITIFYVGFVPNWHFSKGEMSHICVIMPPTLKKLVGHISFCLFVRTSRLFYASCNF